MNELIVVLNSSEDIHRNGVYKLFYIQNPGSFYIGSASSSGNKKGKIGFSRRLSCHTQKLRAGNHYSSLLQSGFHKYGIKSLRMEILEICDPADCRSREQCYLDKLQPNMNTFKSAFDGTGYKHSEASINKMSILRKGKPLSEEAKRNMSKAMKGRSPSNLPLLLSQEVMERAAAGRRKIVRWDSWYNKIRKPVHQFDTKGNFIKTYRSFTDASIESNVQQSSISNCCAGRRKTAGGYIWSYG